MFTLGTHFEEMLRKIQPPQDRLAAARDLPPLVREYLAKEQDFPTVPPHTMLVGSYAQDTCVGDVKDVDFLVQVDGDPDANEPDARKLLRDLGSTLDRLPAALGYEGWTQIEIERARRSVHVYFSDRDFHMDVVPCIAPDGFSNKLYVPDRSFDKWIPSHPVGYVELLDDLNKANGGKVKRLIRLTKQFRNQHMQNRRPKSYWLGALVVHHIRGGSGLDLSEPLAVVFRDLLDAVYSQFDHLLHTSDTATPHIEDPMLGHDISWNWERSHFETFMRRIDEGRHWAGRALETDDRAEAIQLWQRVFGKEAFPTDVTEAAKRAAEMAYPGRSFVTGSGLVLPDRSASEKSIPTQATTFHGQE